MNSVVQDWTTSGMGVQITLDVLRPGGLRYRVSEHNSYPKDLATDSRPTPVFGVEGLLKFATVLNY